MNKFEIRKKILKIRKQNNLKKLKINFNKIEKILDNYKIHKKIIGGYYPHNYEIDAIEILKKFESKNYIISLPKIRKNFQMDFFNWSTKDPLTINEYGIPEPTSNVVNYPNVLLVPLVAYDQNFNRVGYGGGFYDRYINKIKRKKKIITIGLAYSSQKVKKIISNHHDSKLDFIVTEKYN